MLSENKKSQIYLKGENKTKDILKIAKKGENYSVTFKSGKTFTYKPCNVEIIDSSLNNKKSLSCFNYLKEIAKEVGLSVEVEKGKYINVLSYNYSKINFVHPSSMLAKFLQAEKEELEQEESINSEDININPPEAIFPFGFNISQKTAVDKAIDNKLSIVEGPPGTGKTQTILNIIANAIMNDKTIAVVSGNNSATQNVFDKLKKNNIDFIAAYLGNKSNKEEFIKLQKPLPNITDWKLNEEEITKLQQSLSFRYKVLHQKLALQNKLAIMQEELSSIKVEEQHFLQYFSCKTTPETQKIIDKINTSDKAIKIWLLAENYKPSKGLLAIVKIILRYLTTSSKTKTLIDRLLKHHTHNEVVGLFQQRFYKLKNHNLTKDIEKIENELNSFNFSQKMKEYTDLSLKVFRAKLADRYNSDKEREKYIFTDLKYKAKDFLKNYPLVLSTTYSLGSSLSRDIMYDYVIIDEASQVDLCTGALALSCARKAVIVGDLKQLPNVIDSKTSNITDSIFEKYDLSSSYCYKSHSLLSSIIELFPKAPRTTLLEHYRCHPQIIGFCNQKFYDNQLIILTEPKQTYKPLMVYKTVKGNHARDRKNQRQIDVIKNEIIPQQNLSTLDGSLGIVTPYRNQTNALVRSFSGMNVKADTVDKFQGQENDIIILSTVDNDITEFADNANRLNVAVSRAVKQLIVVVNDTDSLNDTNIGDLVRYIEYNNCQVVDSKIYSIFDYLYSDYLKHRKKLLKKYEKISHYDSENLAYALLTDVIKEKGLTNFKVASHIPLRMLIRDKSILTKEEEKYTMKSFTHVDLLVFNKVDKTPKLIIEVDGASYHAEGSKQAERDELKNSILNKYKIPFLRLRTDESNEKQRIIEALS